MSEIKPVAWMAEDNLRPQKIFVFADQNDADAYGQRRGKEVLPLYDQSALDRARAEGFNKAIHTMADYFMAEYFMARFESNGSWTADDIREAILALKKEVK